MLTSRPKVLAILAQDFKLRSTSRHDILASLVNHMPELPEVETTVRGLEKRVLGRTFIDVWSDWEKLAKRPKNFNLFKKEIKGKKIKKVWRRAKNVIFELSKDGAILHIVGSHDIYDR